VPCGSSRGRGSLTAILARMPGRARRRGSPIRPSSISGTSSSNRRTRNSGRRATGPAADPWRCGRFHHVGADAVADAQHLLGISWSRGIMPSMRPTRRSVAALDALHRAGEQVVPGSRSREDLLASASRIFCRITCFAACAPMRPKLDRLERLSTDVADLELGSLPARR